MSEHMRRIELNTFDEHLRRIELNTFDREQSGSKFRLLKSAFIKRSIG